MRMGWTNKFIFGFQFALITIVFFGPRGESRLQEGSSAELFNSKPDWNANGGNHSVGLSPPVGNLAANSIISSNATCGITGPETYCKLLEHVFIASPSRTSQCQVCESHSPDRNKRHSIEYAIDGSNRWWQSPTLQNGRQYEWVTITLDLRQIYQVAYIVIKAAISPRPANWLLERSSDGTSYTPWQYYAATDEECWNRYGILAKLGKPTYDHDEEVICTSYFSKISPFEGGEIHTSLVNGRPGANGPTETLIKFTMARFVRLRFQKISTLKGELMRSNGDMSIKRRYYYSIKDIAIGGHCVCFGHSSECVRQGGSPSQNCLCQHNTCGERCDMCCPLFNQRPWSAGNSTASSACEACQCHGHSDVCVYDPEVDRKSKSLSIHGSYSGGGVCLGCKAQTSGINCEKCQDGYFRPRGVIPSDPAPCIKCKCNSPGSTGNCVTYTEHSSLTLGKKDGECICKEGFSGISCSQCAMGFRGYPKCEPCPCDIAGIVNSDCEGECRCKRNVDGKFCSVCKKGFFNLDKTNPDGCTACFCNGFPRECNSSSLPISEISDHGTWFLTDIQGQKTVQAQRDGQVWQVHNDEVAAFDNYYWTTTEPFTGKKLSSYGLKLLFFVSWIKARGDTSGRPIPEFDVIIQGATSTLAYSHKFYEGNNATISVTLNDHNCFLLAEMDNTIYRDNNFQRETPCTRYEVMRVLFDIKRVLLRGKFHTDQIESMLHYARMENAGFIDESGRRAMSVEVCSCPDGYAGDSCDECSSGYQKTDKNYPLNECIKCNCNGHSQSCDSEGNCLNCENNTTGKECNLCFTGHYRNLFSQITDPCKICECPLAIPSNNFSPTCTGTDTSFECNACPNAYEGVVCERCSNGYFGNPEKPGDFCKPCTCKVSLNIDYTRSDQIICDRSSGECFICPNNTFGWDCTQCKDGYFGNSTIGCSPCKCEYVGSLGIACHQDTGQCTCRSNFGGLRCDTCLSGFYMSNDGCDPCDCDSIGSENSICNTVSGDCRCKPGVSGKFCNECSPNFFGFTSEGCKACDPCDIAGHSCDPSSGRCVCPPNSEGKFCEKCTVGFWGIPAEGCKGCNCSQLGSSVAQCSSTGQCNCAAGYAGRNCNICDFGYYNYPKCTPCGCDSSGTVVSYCQEGGACSCSETGHCPCKENVIGQKCDRCKIGAYDLRPTNPLGCETCFCFHRTNKCSPGNFKWQHLALPSMREVQVSVSGKSQMKIINNLIVISDNGRDMLLAKDVSFGAPMYWQLPHIFLGDKVLSYKGLLRFHVSSEAGRAIFPPSVLATYPLIQIQGNHRLVLEHFTNSSSLVETYEVRLNEDFWRLRHGPLDGVVTKETMMIALQNIQHILIRGTISPEIFNAKFFNVSLDTAVPRFPGDDSEIISTGLEVCECPPQYNSTSCQNPTAGYYRWHKKKYITSTVIIDLVGEAKPCECNDRSRVCDIESGYCQNCSSNTSGFHCDQCLTGYYGNPIDTCQPCPCPSEFQNHADTCSLHSNTNKFQCFCKPGYIGDLCERCDYGFFGNPGATCNSCECNQFGSVSDECDEHTGQCNCRPGITGRDCSKCSSRHVIVRKTCVSCDDACTGILLNETEQFPEFSADSIRNAHSSLICDNLYYLENEWKYLDTQLNSMHFMGSLFKELFAMQNLLSDSLVKANRLKADCSTAVSKSNGHRVTSHSLYARINLIAKQIRELIDTLETYNPNQKPHGVRPNFLAELKSLLASIELVTFKFPMQAAVYQQQQVNKTIIEVIGLSSKYTVVINKISQIREKLVDLNRHIERSQQNREKMKPLIELAKKVLASRRNNTRDIENFLYTTSTLVPNAVNPRSKKLTEISSILEMVEDLLMDIQNRTYDIENIDNTLFEFTPVYNKLYVQPAFAHVEAQKEYAKFLKRLFESISPENEGALKAVGAYAELEKLYKTVLEMSKNTSIIAKNANYKLNLILGNNLDENGLEDLILIKGNKLLSQITTLKTTLKKTKALIQSVQEQIRTTNAFLSRLSIPMDDVPIEFGYLDEVIEDLQETMDEVMEKESDLRSKLDSTHFLPPRTEQNVAEDATDHLNIRQKMNKFNQLYDKLKSEKRTDGLYSKVQYLKSLILQSKHKADTVRISLGPDVSGTCLRLYKWSSIPEATSIRFNFLPLLESDSLLIYWPSSLSEDFVSIEMVNRQIKASWELGSGLRTLTHPRKFRRIGENSDVEPCFQVVFERTGSSVSLNVVIESNISSSSPIQYVPSNDEVTVLDLDPSDLLHVGGMSGKERRSGIVSNGLSGCIHNLKVNQKKVGLWNFVGNEGCSPCAECSDIQVQATLGKLDYFFDGTGYATVNRIQSQTFYAKYFDISIEFRTLMSNGLLFLTANSTASQSISMELRNGQVVFQTCHSCNGIHRDHLQVETTGTRLNNGEWVQLRAIWIFRRGSQTAQLTIGKSGPSYKQEKKSKELTFDLYSAVYQIGGVSPAFFGHHFSALLTNSSFTGCIKNVLIDGTSYDMLSGNYFGVEAHCRHRSLSGPGNGISF